ncbi:hypothetical protein DOFOFD_09270 [Acetobacteraceae bacterium EV16P]|uniref:Uncharacterized protein n=1 Tax=Sorlinia euscelidii TaxID=3081148 RepID=A0ABU7U565_9PROT
MRFSERGTGWIAPCLGLSSRLRHLRSARYRYLTVLIGSSLTTINAADAAIVRKAASILLIFLYSR